MGGPGVSLIEIALVLPGAENGTLRGDVEPEEASADDSDGGNDVDVANGHAEDQSQLGMRID